MRRRVFRRSFAALVAVLALVAAACGGDDDGGGGDAEETPVTGGTLTWAQSAEPNTFDPVRGSAGTGTSGAAVYQAVYDSLVYMDGETGEPVMGLAESATSNTDGTVWTIKLRPNVKFSDGTPFNAAAVKASWDRLADPARASTSLAQMRTLTSWVPQDDLTLVVTLPRARGSFLQLLSLNLGAIPSPTAVATHGANYGSSAETTVGAGAFTVKEWTRNSQIVVARNPSYFREGRPYLDSIIFKTIPEPDTQADALRTNTVDIMYNTNRPDLAAQLDDEGFTMSEAINAPAYGSLFNFSRPPFDDIRVRRAFVLATDAADINTKAVNGAGVLAGGPDTAFYPEDHPLHDESVRQTNNNLAEAQKLIDAYVAEKGPIDVEVTAPNSLQGLTEAVIQSWARLKNITVRSNVQTAAQAILLFSQGNYTANVTLTPAADYIDQMYILYKTGSPQNIQRYSNPKVDELLERGYGVSAEAERKKLMNDLAKLLLDDAAMVRVFHAAFYVPMQDHVGGASEGTFTPSKQPLPHLLFRKS